ncbi:MAG: nucleoside triphosphate pyrophosphohydrolase [Clostridia bacterium]|nr:nucleoside triphosphate pyrophosphohydrolase [Clostridia bacterium]
MNFDKKDYTFSDLIDIIYMLRSDNGCPWDRVQTHDSIKMNLVEEAYEAIEALDSGDKMKFADELGDILLQVVFHSVIGEEDKTFAVSDVINAVCHKMVSRHTHIFGNDKADTPDEVLDTWNKNKLIEKGLKSNAEDLKSVCHYLPALIRARKVQSKAAKVGFDWDSVSGALDKLSEEIEELKSAINAQNEENISEELGDLIFSAVNVSRFLKVEPEEALTKSTEKFISRFEKLENAAKSQNKELSDMSLSEMDKLWEDIKKQ